MSQPECPGKLIDKPVVNPENAALLLASIWIDGTFKQQIVHSPAMQLWAMACSMGFVQVIGDIAQVVRAQHS